MLHIVVAPALKEAPVPLNSFPGFNTEYEDEDRSEGEGPFPRDAGMLEDAGIEVRDIDCREDRECANEDRKEKELVLVDIFEEGEAAHGCRVQTEHAAAETL